MRKNYYQPLIGSKKDTESKQKCEAPKVKYSICSKEGYVGIYCDDANQITDVKFYNETSIACLQILEQLLEDIPSNEECISPSISIVYVPDMISALVTGGVADYIRLGKNKSGEAIDQDKLDLYFNIDRMAREKSYNVVLRSYDFQDSAFRTEVVAWVKEAARCAAARANGVERTPKQSAVTSTTNPALDALNKQVLEAVAKKDMETAMELGKLIAVMSGQKPEEQKGSAEA